MVKCQICSGKTTIKECSDCSKKICKECYDKETGKCILCRQGEMIL